MFRIMISTGETTPLSGFEQNLLRFIICLRLYELESSRRQGKAECQWVPALVSRSMGTRVNKMPGSGRGICM